MALKDGSVISLARDCKFKLTNHALIGTIYSSTVDDFNKIYFYSSENYNEFYSF